ncbi:MAG: GMC oxidoreductase [Pseudobdellovibrionaceae bacterium]
MGQALHYDICIVGSGAAGSFVAHALKNSDLKVCLIETGDERVDSSTEPFISHIQAEQQTKLAQGFSRQLGGSTNLWAGRVAPFEAHDFEGWPFPLDELIPFYNRASEIMGVPPYAYFTDKKDVPAQDSGLTHFLTRLKKSDTDEKRFVWSTPPFNARTALLEEIKNGQCHNITLRMNMQVKSLAHENGHVTALACINENGEEESLTAKRFVLAAGGIETPRLLLNSDNLGNAHDQVGRYLSTHPKADMGVMLLKKRIGLSHPYLTDMDFEGLSLRFGLGLPEEKLKQVKLNHYVQITPLLEYTASNLFEKVKNSSPVNAKLINKNKVMSGFLPGLGLLIFEIIGRIAKLQPKSKKFILRAFLDQFPDADNRITLDNETDKNGMKKARLDWRFTDQDKASVLAFFDALDAEIRKNDLGHLEYSKLREIKDWPMVALHSHFMGTTRMGENPEVSVTDAQGKVHGVDNLYIAGPSLFPTYGYANPVYTIAALSLRLGELLKRTT